MSAIQQALLAEAAASSGPTATITFDWSAGLDGNWTYGGGANGTRFNSSGLVAAASSGRLFYNPVTLAFDGLMGEEARTNAIIQSAALDNAAWGTFASSITANSTTSPDGGVNAETFIGSTQSGGSPATLFPSSVIASLVAPNHFALSVFCKDSTAGFLWFDFGPSANNWVAAAYNVGASPATGSTSTGATSGTIIQNRIDSVGSSWSRPQLSGFTGGTASYTTLGIFEATPSSPPNGGLDTSGNAFYFATTPTVFLWGAQAEAGDFSSSYIPTTTVAVTRSADTATSTNATMLAALAFVLQAKTAVYIASGATQVLWQMDDTTANNRLRIERQSDTSIHFIVTVAGVSQCDLNLGNVANATAFKVSVRYGANDFSGSLNGAAVVTDVSGTVPTPTTGRLFTDTAGAHYWMNTLAKLTCYSTLTNGQLVTLST